MSGSWQLAHRAKHRMAESRRAWVRGEGRCRRRELEGVLHGQGLGVVIVQVVQEPSQNALGAVELVTQCTAHRQVVLDQAPQVLEFLRPGGHDAPPPVGTVGHGRVSVDSLTWSVLA